MGRAGRSVTAYAVSVVVGVVAVGCGTTPSKREGEAAGLGFGWPIPSRAQVVERVEAPGGAVEIAYGIELSKDGDGYRLRHTSAEVREADGIVVGYDDRKRQLARTAYRVMELTDMELDQDLQVTRCVESPVLRAYVSTLVDGLDKAPRAAYEVQFRETSEAAVAAQGCIARWQSWVLAWVGFAARPGTPDRWSPEGESEIGEEPKIRVVDTHEGESPDAVGLVRLTRHQEIDAEVLTGDVGELAADLSRDTKTPIEATRVTIDGATHEGMADLDERTLRPAKVAWTSEIRYALDGLSKVRVTRKSWSFRFE